MLLHWPLVSIISAEMLSVPLLLWRDPWCVKDGPFFSVMTSRRRTFPLPLALSRRVGTRLDRVVPLQFWLRIGSQKPACFCFPPCGAPSHHGERASYPAGETPETELPSCAPAIPATPADASDVRVKASLVASPRRVSPCLQ